MVFDAFFNSIFSWAIQISPLFGIFFVSAVITLLTTLVYKYATDQKVLKALREDLSRLQKEMTQEKHNPQKMGELNSQIWQKNLESMKHGLKPMIITFIPVIIIFQWMRATFAPYGNVLFFLGWFGTYFIITLILSITFRKLLKVY